MLNIPGLSRIFSTALLVLGIWLAVENTLISADVLSRESGASTVSSVAIAVAATGIELIVASFLRSDDSGEQAKQFFGKLSIHRFFRFFVVGIGLALVYHFDILTTAKHPSFISSDPYFFGVVVGAFVFGPEVCIVLSAWLWRTARNNATHQMAMDNSKDAEHAYRRAEKQQLVSMAEQAGKDAAIQKATSRWAKS